jgi:hopanoid-associated phosphorylase
MLGILCGLESEAKIARRIKGAVVALSAAEPKQAREAAESLVAKGCTRLMSFGVAGGLSPDLKAGDGMIGSEVSSPEGQWAADAAWAEKLRADNPWALWGGVRGADHIVDTTGEKNALFHGSKALMVDMESHVVAQAAAAHNLPFAIIRVVVDPNDLTVPPATLVPFKPDGTFDLWGVAKSVIREPRQISVLIGLGRNMAKALRCLSLYKIDASF